LSSSSWVRTASTISSCCATGWCRLSSSCQVDHPSMVIGAATTDGSTAARSSPQRVKSD
jgi:hypothetical protein